MEVKDVPNAVVQTDVKNINNQVVKSVVADAASVEAAVSANPEAVSAVTVSLSPNSKASSNNEVRARTNGTIEAINIASDSTTQIGSFLTSLQGIIEQAFSAPDDKKKLLADEGAGLVTAIKDKAHVESSDGIKPLSGDEIRLEIEETLGRSLDVILPDDASHAFGIGKLEFSTKESIINTRAVVAEAQRRFERLRESVDKAVKSVRQTVNEVDVAIQNTEASDFNIRDIDVALKATGAARSAIREFPSEALNSVGEFDQDVLGSASK